MTSDIPDDVRKLAETVAREVSLTGSSTFKMLAKCAARAILADRATRQPEPAGVDVSLTMQGDGRFYDEDDGEWELTKETYEARTADCSCSHCVARRAALTHPARDAGPAAAGVEEAARVVLDTFSRDEAQGYRSKDRQFAISILGAALLTARQEERVREEDPVLTRGEFSCLSSFAVEQAHVLSWARVSADEEGGLAMETGEILAEYARGQINADEAVEALRTDIPALREKEAGA